MNILLIASETSPYYKTGGLAEVVYGLAKELNNQGQDARIIVPRYRAYLARPSIEMVCEKMPVKLGSYARLANIWKSRTTPITYFVQQDYYFGRNDLYGYPDDYERFIFFTLAALEMLRNKRFRKNEKDWFPEVIQGHDWPTGLMPNWLRRYATQDQRFVNVRFILHIHNIRRLGIFGSRSLQLARQDEDGYYKEIGEKDEQVNFLGRGILFADKVVTVNPNYGDNNPLPQSANVMESVIKARLAEGDFLSIRNGIDEEDEYDPSRDKRIDQTFRPASLASRSRNKLALQKALGFKQDATIPLLGMVSRLIPENGFDLLKVLHDKRNELDEFQLAILADPGASDYQEMLQLWESEQNSDRPWVRSIFLFDERLARRIYAGCDIFLIPALEFPSGINQYIAMRYGAIPIVRHTGALCDSVIHYKPDIKLNDLNRSGAGVGFKFFEFDSGEFLATVKTAIVLYRQPNSPVWRNLQLFNMRASFNWGHPTAEYLNLYQRTWKENPTPIYKGTLLNLDREARLLQAILEVDNLPGLGARKGEEILKQASRLIRTVLGGDAVYVWGIGENLELTSKDAVFPTNVKIVEFTLDQQNHRKAPPLEKVAELLHPRVSNTWRQLGDIDLNGICQPITNLDQSPLAIQEGWSAGLSIPISVHGRLFGRIDVLFKKMLHDEQWLALSLTALANSFGLRLATVQAADEMDDIHAMAVQLLNAHSYDGIVQEICGWARKLTLAQEVWLYGEQDSELIAMVPTNSARFGMEQAKLVWESGEISYIADWIESPRDENGRRLYRSLMVAPLIKKLPDETEEKIGVMALVHAQSAVFTHDHEQVLERYLASQAATALSTANWQRHRDESYEKKLSKFSENLQLLSGVLIGSQGRKTLMDNIVQKIKEVLDVDATSLYLADKRRERLTIQAASGYQEKLMKVTPLPSYRWGEGVTGRIADSNKPFKADSLQDLRTQGGSNRGRFDEQQNNLQPESFYGISLSVEGEARPIGVLKVERLQRRPFTDEEVLLINMMGNVIAAVVYNAQDSEKKLAKFSENLGLLSGVLIGSQGRKILMDNIVQKIKEVVDVDAASLFLVDDRRERLTIQAASGYQEKLMKVAPLPSYRWGEGVTGRIADSNKPFKADSLQDLRTQGGSNRGRFDEQQNNLQPESFYGIPLSVEGEARPIGVLKVERLQRRPFTAEEELLINMMGNVIAAVVYNAQDSEKKLAKFSENLQLLSGVLIGSQGRKILMDNIVQKIKEVVDVDAASFFLADDRRERLTIEAASGYQEKLMKITPLPSYRWGEGVTGRIADSNKPFKADSLQDLRTQGGSNRGRFDEQQNNLQPESFYGISLSVEGEARPIGVLKVERLQRRPFTAEEELLINMMGNVIAAVVYNAQDIEKKLAKFSENLKDLSAVLTPGDQSAQEWFQKIVEKISNVSTTDAATLYLVDESNQRLVIAAASGYQKPLMQVKAYYEWGEGVTGQIAQSGVPISADSLQKLREQGKSRRGKYDDLQGGNQPNSFYGVPLKVTGRDKPIGVLKFESLKERFFSEESRLLIDMMANVIATVIHNTQQGEKRVGDILRKMGTLSQPLDASAYVLQKYAEEKDAGLVNQIAVALAEYLGLAPQRIELEAEKIFEARKRIDPSLRADLYERIASWARNLGKSDRLEWEFALYEAILRSKVRRDTEWSQVKNTAEPWIRLKNNASAPTKFEEAANSLVGDLAQLIQVKFSAKGMDASKSWFKTIFDTEEIFGEQVKNILVLFQSQGELDENNQRRLEQLSTQDAEHPYLVLFIVLWNTGVTSQQIKNTREHLKGRKIDTVFASIADILHIMEDVSPKDRFRTLVLRQVTIASPFVTMGAVPEALFFGRDEEIKTLTHKPTDSDFAIIGNRKIGKTSLYNKVYSILSFNPRLQPLQINCQAVQNRREFFQRFQVQTGIKLADTTPEGFEQTMRHLLHHGNRTPIVLIDEVDDLLANEQKSGEPLVRIWRSLAQEKACRFIFFGSKRLAQQINNPKSNLFNFAEPLPLGYLSEQTTSLVLTKPLEQLDVELDNKKAIIDEVFRLTSGHPNLTQYLGKSLVDAANKRRERRILYKDILEIGRSSEFRDEYLKIIWGDAGPLERLITLLAPGIEFRLTDIALALTRNGVVVQEEPAHVITEQPSQLATQGQISLQVLWNALKMLQYYSVLKESQQVYKFVPSSFLEILHSLPTQVIQSEIKSAIQMLLKSNQSEAKLE